MVQWINLNQKNRFVVAILIFCTMIKNYAHTPTASGSYSRPADEMQTDFKTFKILYRLNYSDFFV